MVTFVEFQMINKMKSNFCRLEYIPNLAAAQLMACFKAEKLKTNLVKGQTRYLKDVFINEQKELFDLLSRLNNYDLVKANQIGLSNMLLIHRLFKKDEAEFSTILKNNYKIATGQSVKDYSDKQKLLNLLRIKNGIFELYDFYYNIKKEKNLSIINNLFNSIKKTKPDIVAFSFKSNYDYDHIEYVSDYVKEVISMVKKRLNVPVIAAGSVLSSMENVEKYIFKSLDIDYFIFSDGKLELPFLIKSIEERRPIKRIPNLCFQEKGKILRTFEKNHTNLNSLPPPDFSDFDLDKYFFPERILPIDVAPVCYWKKCVFCAELPKIKYCTMSKEKFLEIIKKYKEDFKTNFIEIQSTSPSADQLKMYMDILIKNKVNDVFFASLSRFEDEYCKKKTAEMLYRGGMRYFMWGLESGCQKTLDKMNKGINLIKVKKILKNFNENGIKNMCYVMVGFPGETKEEFKKTVDFLQKNSNNIDGTIITPFNLFKNSYIANHPKEFFIKRMWENEDNPATCRFELSKGFSQKESKDTLNEVREKIESQKIKISNKNMDPIDQFYLDKISGNDALHHILFYIDVKRKEKI